MNRRSEKNTRLLGLDFCPRFFLITQTSKLSAHSSPVLYRQKAKKSLMTLVIYLVLFYLTHRLLFFFRRVLVLCFVERFTSHNLKYSFFVL